MTLDEEWEALHVWNNQKLEEYSKLSDRKRACIRIKGLDSPLDIIQKYMFKESARRMRELKKKYGIATAKELEYLKDTRYDEEMYALSEWLKERALECLEAVESGKVDQKNLYTALLPEDEKELYRREREIDEKYGKK